MILYKLTQNTNEKMEGAYGKFYARPVITETIDITGLAEHLSEHNTGFSPGACRGLLTDTVRCIKELVLKGIAVKIDDLAIFSIGFRPKKGADSADDFSVAKNIEGVKLRSRATGSFSNSNLDVLAELKNVNSLLPSGESNGSGGTDPDTTPDGGSDTKGDDTSGGGGKSDTSDTDSGKSDTSGTDTDSSKDDGSEEF